MMETAVASAYIQDWNDDVITVKQKIEKLKAWHKARENKLMQRPILHSPDTDKSNDSDGTNLASKSSSINGVSKKILQPENGFQSHKDIDEQPVISAHLDFYSLLDEKLRDGIASDVQTSNKSIEKKPFLRKGEGLTRFRMKSEDFQLKKRTSVGRRNETKPISSSVPESTAREKNHVSDETVDNSPLAAFEILEEKTNDSSFCSTSSMVAQLMEDSIKSTPIKNDEVSKPIERNPRSNLFGIDYELLGPRTLGVIDEEPSRLDSSKDESNNRVNNDPRCKLISINTNEHGSENYSDDEHSDNSECSAKCSCCQDTSNILSTSVSIIAEETTIYSPLKNESRRQIHCAKIDRTSYSLNEGSNCIEYETYDEDALKSLLRTRILELEAEIDAFRTENSQMIKLRNDYEKEYSKFCQEKMQLMSKIRAEHLKGVKELEEEKRKFRMEQTAFEKYVKEVKNRPNKQEKEEMRLLKEEIKLLKEEMNKKESRWAAAQARIRTEVKLLKDHNSALKEELNDLKKPAKKVTFAPALKKSKSSPNIDRKEKVAKLVTNETGKQSELPLPKSTNNLSGLHSPNFECSNIDYISTIRTPDNSRSSNDTSSIASDLRRSICVSSYVNEDSSKDSDQDVVSDLSEKTTTSAEVYESLDASGNRERLYSDGWKEIWCSNGSVKKISPDGKIIKTIYYNGDVQEILNDEEIIKYYHAESKTWHKQFKDGLEIKEFPNGQIEKSFQDGSKEITLPNGSVYSESPSGVKKMNLADGTVISINEQKQEKRIVFPNGEIEIHTSEYKRREYPDGRVRTVYNASGLQETKYANGRVRLKAKDGSLLSDTGIS